MRYYSFFYDLLDFSRKAVSSFLQQDDLNIQKYIVDFNLNSTCQKELLEETVI